MEQRLTISSQLRRNIIDVSNYHKNAFYIYNIKRINKNCNKFLKIPYQPKSINFAMMANSTPEFVGILKQAGLNIFVNSVLHLNIALELGYGGDDIVFAASAMDDATMKQVNDSGAVVVLDSVGQLERWNSLFPNKRIGVRCNIGELVKPKKTIAGYFIGKESRLGLTLDEINNLKGNIQINGLHVYVGTNITDIDYFLTCYSQIIKLAELFPNLQFLDFGGGFGLEEESSEVFDFAAYGEKVTDLMNSLSKKLNKQVKLILEPGRIIGGDAGYFVCNVVDIKTRNGQQLIGVNASSVQFPRPLFYPDDVFHPVTVIHQNRQPESYKEVISTIYGCSTYSRDFLAKDINLPVVSVGDIVVIGYAGSYCATAHTGFLGFPPVKEVFV